MDDLIGEFIEETSESLSTLDLELVSLEQNPEDEKILGNIFRLVHTIKGTCGFLGLGRLESVAHSSENILCMIRDKTMPVTPLAISLILESLDSIKELIAHLASNGAEPAGSDADLIGRLNAFANGETPAESAVAAMSTEAVPAPTEEEKAGETLPEDDRKSVEEILKNLPKNMDGNEDALQKLFDSLPSPLEATTPKAEAKPDAKPEPKAEAPHPTPAPAPAPAAAAMDHAVQKGLEIAEKDGDAKGGNNMANQSIRVNLDVLESLMQMVGELVLTRNQLLQLTRGSIAKEFTVPIQRLSHITSELQEQVMKTRMQPIGNAWAKFPRMIRDLAMELNKKIELRMLGAETELDRQLLEMIKDPLTHMVRNSADHGLEKPEDRRAAGKPELGTVTLSAYHEGGHIIIEISDDGRGINIDRVKEKALQNGLGTAEEIAAMSESQIIQFIFKAGFSTADKITSVSGRGVGMDVVRTNIEKIGGTIELHSVYGKGSTFHIKIPLTLAIVSVLILESGKQCFAIPQINVLELVRSNKRSNYQIEEINGSAVLRLRDKLLPLLCLSEVLQIEHKRDHDIMESSYIVVCKVGGMEFGLIVDEIFDTEEIVVKPKSELLRDLDIYSGTTILGDGGVIMILDPGGLARRLGSIDTGKQLENAVSGSEKDAELISFLLFSSGGKNPKAIPLELVARLEEIDTAKIEHSSGYPVVQYRDTLMRLTSYDNMPIPEKGTCEVMVFQYDGRIMGMVVKEILDIIKAPYALKIKANHAGLMGSMVLAGKTTDIIDIGHYIADIFGTMGGEPSTDLRQRILFAEDSPFFRNLTVPFLQQAGFEVHAFENGEAALEFLQRNVSVDIIVTDIEMPGIGGFELTRTLRKDPQFNHIPIFGFTSTVNEKLIEQAKQAGFSDYIEKTNRSQLIEAIRSHSQANAPKQLMGA